MSDKFGVYPDIIFECKECRHPVYVKKDRPDLVIGMASAECPCCEVQQDLNWVLRGEGDFKNVRKPDKF